MRNMYQAQHTAACWNATAAWTDIAFTHCDEIFFNHSYINNAYMHACLCLPATAAGRTSPSRAAASLPPLPLMLGAERADGAAPDPDCFDIIPPMLRAAAAVGAVDQWALR